MYKCFHCLSRSVIWDCDDDFSEDKDDLQLNEDENGQLYLNEVYGG